MSVWEELAALGSATVYEAAGRRGLVDAPFVRVVPGSRAAGPARTVRCGQDDNLMVHAAMERVEPGDVLVLTMPEPTAVALVGELLMTQVAHRRAAAVLVDAAVRDVEELAENVAWQLLARWGVVFRDVYLKERLALPWRETLWALRRLEARGLTRGGHFVTGVTGEQFANETTIPLLRRRGGAQRLTSIAPEPRALAP